MIRRLNKKYISFILVTTLSMSLTGVVAEGINEKDIKTENNISESVDSTKKENVDTTEASADKKTKEEEVKKEANEDVVKEEEKKEEAKEISQSELKAKYGIKFVDYGEEINNELLSGIRLIHDYTQNKNNECLIKAMDSYVSAHTKLKDSQVELHVDDDQFDFIFKSIISLGIVNEKGPQEEVLIHCANSLYKAIALREENETLTQIVFTYHTKWAFVEANSKSGFIYANTSKKVSATFRKAYELSYLFIHGSPMMGEYDSTFIPSENLGSNYDKYVPVHDDPYEDIGDIFEEVLPPAPEIAEPTPPIEVPPVNEEDEDLVEWEEGVPRPGEDNYESNYYEMQDGKCYMKKVISKDGKVTEELSELPQSLYNYCGITDYIEANGPAYYYDEKSEIIINTKYNIDKELSDNTLQFTLDKSSGEKAYYYDTGIRVTEDSKVSYDTLKNVYKFIALNSNSFYVRDGDAVMTVVDGRPYYLNDKGEEFTKEEVDGLFDKNDSVDVKIDKAKSRITSSVEVEKNAQKIFYKGEEIKFKNKPIEEGSVDIYPLKEVVETIGATFTKEGDKIIIENDKGNVIYYLNTTRVINNGQIKEISIKTSEKNGVIYGQLLDVLIGLEFNYDRSGNCIYIE